VHSYTPAFPDDYQVSADGQLDRLMLVHAQRRKLETDRKYDASNRPTLTV